MSSTLIRAERPLFEGADWEFSTIQRCHDEISKIALGEMGLDVYTNQIEVIGTEQMLDAYSSIGMPLFYKHWSFGKHFARNEAMYQAGMQGLAYEIVINSNPCISYIMEENTATMQTLVIAHAAFGHNHFFKNNYLFQQWTDANGILDYLEFARDYIMSCEERYGEAAVERLLDAAHALMSHAVHKYPRKRQADLRSEEKRERERREHDEKVFNDLWRTVPGKDNAKINPTAEEQRKAILQLPQENILYFMEKTAPRLASWQREILRIVRIIAQYFYPQSQTKVMNEGCATYTHYTIMNRLHEKGLLTDGAMVEFLSSHTNVVFQPEFDDRRYSGINPYALGFAMMQDIERICKVPTAEDKQWFPHIAGCNDHMNVLRDVWANYRDESFILQYLSPKLVRHFGLFHVMDDASEPNLRVEAIHDERGYRKIKQALARHYDVSWTAADIQVVDVNLAGDRRLILHHRALNRVLLEEKDARQVLQHLADLWGYDVLMKEIDPSTEAVLKEHAATPRPGIIKSDAP
jgi:spore cortex formation protein SpoVR/YcgB (stage V sporulation)